MRPIIALSKWGLDEGLTSKVFFLQICVELSFKIIHTFVSYFLQRFWINLIFFKQMLVAYLIKSGDVCETSSSGAVSTYTTFYVNRFIGSFLGALDGKWWNISLALASHLNRHFKLGGQIFHFYCNATPLWHNQYSPLLNWVETVET